IGSYFNSVKLFNIKFYFYRKYLWLLSIFVPLCLIADLGFYGKIGRKDGHMFPAYYVMTGAKTGQSGQTAYAEKIDEVPTHYVPDIAYHFLKDWIQQKKAKTYPSYHAYLEAEGNALIKKLCDQYRDIPTFEVDPDFYKDFGSKRVFSLDEMGAAECSAGMFDMIDVDKRRISSNTKELPEITDPTKKQEALYAILHASSRMLLVTRGFDARNDEQAFSYFGKHFVDTDLVSKEYQDVVTLGKLKVLSELPKHEEKIVQLGRDIVALYSSMDDSLRFNAEKKKSEKEKGDTKESLLKKDYRGVACPMNFVKTKLVLETMEKGQQLEILLDDGEPIQNVPNSVKLEGHKVLDQTKTNENYWKVLIEKN
ncbi:MAG: sulfurtransferase TusA family protein, partial [Candidatus Margulisbacteria bacterium]|nr:sulfurtransferase TusA family protein [Candidatus Margulisiibacteriota bacterium]